MPNAELNELLSQLLHDGMSLRSVRLAAKEVVYFKSLLEAYPAVATVHAAAGPVAGSEAELFLATTKGLQAELDGIMKDLADELTLVVTDVDADSMAGEWGGNA